MFEDVATEALLRAIDSRPRLPLAHLPTPLEEAPRLSARLGVRVLVKRDDQTGLALGGNKVRKLEFLIADALEQGADVVVTTGGSQSNHARLTAAACLRAGLDCYLVLDRGVHPEWQGNLLLDRLLGAQVRLIESQDPAVATAEMDTLAEELRRQGRRPYIIPRGGAVPAGATGYVAFVPELLTQAERWGKGPFHLYLATGSTGTHSGVIAGLAATQAPVTVQGISVSRDRAQQTAKILELAAATLRHLDLDVEVPVSRVLVDDHYVGPGYGHPTDATLEAIEIAARDEALILDPVYTGKAMAGLIGHAAEGRFSPDDTVVFLHTGGSPALFAYHREIMGGHPLTPQPPSPTHGRGGLIAGSAGEDLPLSHILVGRPLGGRLRGPGGEGIAFLRHAYRVWRAGQLRFRLETFGFYYPALPYRRPWWKVSPRAAMGFARQLPSYVRWLAEMENLRRQGPRGWWARHLERGTDDWHAARDEHAPLV